MKTWFISDLHLDAQQMGITRTLLAFFSTLDTQTDAIYILGDFFEYWVGDDQLDVTLQAALSTLDVESTEDKPLHAVIRALRELSGRGIRLYFQHGNRDFLVGERFAQATGCTLLPEQVVVDLYGTPTLLMHGDSLCTDDVEYQQARKLLRHPQWQQQFLSQPLATRLAQAQAMREQSRESMQGKDYTILDVNQQAVNTVMQTAGVTRLIHGHTHRPAVHEWQNATGNKLQRIVLGDWHEGHPSYLFADSQAIKLMF